MKAPWLIVLSSILLGPFLQTAHTEDNNNAPSDPSNHSGTAVRQFQKLLSAGGLSLNLTQAIEAYHAGYGRSGGETNARGLSDIELQWKLPRYSQGGSVNVKYSIYSEALPSSDPTAQGVSNLTTKPFHGFVSAYYEAPLGPKLRFKVGIVDANTEFAVIRNAGDFSNASMGVSPTLSSMPSYPRGALSANVFGSIHKWLEAGTGIYRTAGGAVFSVSEANLHTAGRYQSRVSAGFWKQSASMSGKAGRSGEYLTYEQIVLPLANENRGLRVFARVSRAGEMHSPIANHVTYGATWTGLRIKDDSLGFAILDMVPVYDGHRLQMEKIYEVYYKMPAGRYATIKADLQHIQQAGGFPDAGGGLVASVRLIFHLNTIEP